MKDYRVRPAVPSDVTKLPTVERKAATLFEALREELGLGSLGQVNPVDSGLIQANFGSTDEALLCQYDVDCDGQINPVDSGIVQSLNIFAVTHAALANNDRVSGQQRPDALGDAKVHIKGMEIAVVDANEAGAGQHGPLGLLFVVDFN